MRQLPKPLYLAAGAYTVSLGTGRPEFNPRKARPGLEHYIQEAGKAVLSQISDPALIDEGVIGNFMAARFNKQGHLGSLMILAHPSLEYKPTLRVEGACASGGLALATGLKSVASGLAESVLVMGVEVQNTVKAVYGADILGGAGWFAGERKNGGTYFFPQRFSDRAGAFSAKYGAERARQAMAHWYATAVEHARLNPQAQEHHNRTKDLVAQGLTPPNPRSFCEHINLFDCSKVSDGAAGIIVCTKEGYERLGLTRDDVVEIVGYGHAAANLTLPPPDQTALTTSRRASAEARAMAGIQPQDLGVIEVHDCFSITGLLSLEALELAQPGGSIDLVLAGENKRTGRYPTNTGGGLIGYGHPTGASGVRMAVDLWKQLTGRAGDYQVPMTKDHGIMISMGGNDKTVVSLVLRR
ncbi:MAG: 3-ketoacyl-CoA thiolase [Firmicutes bacterium]|nr:3-ketoacyl-CoA thiolase [Bacillota bacterium]